MRLFVHHIEINAMIGALSAEEGCTQPLLIDIEAEVDPPMRDDLADAVDYRDFVQIAGNALTKHVVLLETAASLIAEACLAQPEILEVMVTARKPRALTPAMAGVVVTLRKDGR